MVDASSYSMGHFPHLLITTIKILPIVLFVSVSLALFRFYLHAGIPVPPFHPILISSPASKPDVSAHEEQFIIANEASCDYSNGKWVQHSDGPLYDGTRCGTIKEGQNCIAHGRPDMGFLYWRWEPTLCELPRFEPNKFLQLLANKHLAFVGDSLARNQLESLLCMLATVSVPKLVYKHGKQNEFRRWNIVSHNVTISLYWSPFLVKGVEKSNLDPNNKLYLDYVDERWAAELGLFDTIVLTIGHWYLLPGVYYKGNEHVLGCHYCPGLNYTEIGFYDVFRMALRTSIATIKERRGNKGPGNREINVVVTTFPPSHFEGEWDKFGACAKTRPFQEGEIELGGMEARMRQVVIEEVENLKFGGSNNNMRVEALDVSKLSSMRPDGHPAAYMHPFPFANGVTDQDRVQNDCVHWCLPGPIDTWNEILLELVERWWRHSRKKIKFY